MSGPGSLGSAMPPQEDDQQRRSKDLERSIREQAAAQSLAASTLGNGGTLTVNGSLVINGTITTPGTLSSAGAINAGTTMSAGANITSTGGDIISSSGNVSGATVTASGSVTAGANVSASGQVISAGIINSTGTKANTVTVGYSAVYIDSTGNMGGNTSSRRYKQDITPIVTDTVGFLGLTTYKFRYIAAVQELGAAAPYEYGLMAEDVVKVAPWACFYEADGVTVRGINYDRLVVTLLNVVQDHERRLKAAGL